MLAREEIRPVKLLLKQKEGAEAFAFGKDLFVSLPVSCKISCLSTAWIWFVEFLWATGIALTARNIFCGYTLAYNTVMSPQLSALQKTTAGDCMTFLWHASIRCVITPLLDFTKQGLHTRPTHFAGGTSSQYFFWNGQVILWNVQGPTVACPHHSLTAAHLCTKELPS